MRIMILMIIAAIGAAMPGASAAEDSKLLNGDFSQGKKFWWQYYNKEYVNKGFICNFENSCYTANVPAMDKPVSYMLQLGQKVNLLPDVAYEMSFTLQAEKPGEIAVAYKNNEHTIKIIKIAVDSGEHTYRAVFNGVAVKSEKEVTAVWLFLGMLNGKLVLSNLSLKEKSISLSPEWKGFFNVIPPQDYSSVPAALDSPQGESISGVPIILTGNTFDLQKFRKPDVEKPQAIFYNAFESDYGGNIKLGFSADWWMKIYVNGKQVYATPSGNASHKFVPEDHIVDLPLRQGKNLLALEITAGSEGWRLVCGTPKQEEPFFFTRTINGNPRISLICM